MRTVTPAQFALQMRALPATVEKSTRSAVEKSALQLTSHARLNIAAATGGDSRLSHVGKRGGAKVGARYKLNRSTSNPSALIFAEGPLQIIERDTKAHGEIPRSVGRLQRRSDGVLDRSRSARHDAKQRLYSALFGSGGFSGATPLSTPYGPRFKVAHPGTKGKHPFGRAVTAETPHIPTTFQRELQAGLARVFR